MKGKTPSLQRFIAESDIIEMRGEDASHNGGTPRITECEASSPRITIILPLAIPARLRRPPVRRFIINAFPPPHQKVFSLIHIKNVQN